MVVVAGVEVRSPYGLDPFFASAPAVAPYAEPVQFGPVPGSSDAERAVIAIRAFDPITRGGQQARDQVAAFAGGIQGRNPAAAVLRETLNFRGSAAGRSCGRGAHPRPVGRADRARRSSRGC